MKSPLFIILLCVLVNNTVIATDFQIFTDKKERSVEAKIIAYSSTSRKV